MATVYNYANFLNKMQIYNRRVFMVTDTLASFSSFLHCVNEGQRGLVAQLGAVLTHLSIYFS